MACQKWDVGEILWWRKTSKSTAVWNTFVMVSTCFPNERLWSLTQQLSIVQGFRKTLGVLAHFPSNDLSETTERWQHQQQLPTVPCLVHYNNFCLHFALGMLESAVTVSSLIAFCKIIFHPGCETSYLFFFNEQLCLPCVEIQSRPY